MDVIDPIEKARRGKGGPVELQGQSHPARLPPEEGEPARETQAGENMARARGRDTGRAEQGRGRERRLGSSFSGADQGLSALPVPFPQQVGDAGLMVNAVSKNGKTTLP